MSGVRTYQSLNNLVTRLRDDLNNKELSRSHAPVGVHASPQPTPNYFTASPAWECIRSFTNG